MPDVNDARYTAGRDAIAAARLRAVGSPYVHLAANSAARTQEIRGLGFSETDAKWLASLDGKTLDKVLPTADAIQIARDNGLDDMASLVRVLAAQCHPPIGVPADFGGGEVDGSATVKDASGATRPVRVG